MQFIGQNGSWAAYQHGTKTVFVHTETLMTTDPQDDASLVASAGLVPGDAPDEAVSLAAAEAFIGPAVFSDAFGEDQMIKVPAGVRAAAKRALEWRRLYKRGGTDVGVNTARMLADHDRISLKKVRHIAKYFPRHEVDSKADGWKSGEEGFPSAGRIAWDLWGGDAGRRWASAKVKGADARALAASAFAVEEDLSEVDESGGTDPSVPHVFQPSVNQPYACRYCLKHPDNEVHDENAVDYALIDVNSERAHLFTESPQDENLCAVCGQEDSAWQHVHAAAALTLISRSTFDFHKSLQKDLPLPVTAAGVVRAGHEFSLEAVQKIAAASSYRDSRVLFAVFDAVDYFVTVDKMDPYLATGLFRHDGEVWQRWSPLSMRWFTEAPTSPTYLVDVDDETAEFVALNLHSFAEAVDMREADPQEAALHEECLAGIDWDFIDTLLQTENDFVLAASAGLFNDGYTPEERSENAKRQVRDKNGRFAKSNDKVYLPDGTPGKISKINPETQEVTIVSDVDGEETTISAKEIVIRDPQPPTKLDLDKIRAVPRAVSTTPKGWFKNTLPPLSPERIQSIISDYSAYIERERRERVDAFSSITKDENGVEHYTSLEGLDVAPIYMAIVDDVDNEAILDMIAIIPASSEGGEVQTVRRNDIGWEIDPDIKTELLSTIPPAVVTLEGDQIKEVEDQVVAWYSSQNGGEAALYDAFGTIIAAGGADRNRGNAERLRRYWLTGEGAAKIRWNTPGDWKRCYKNLVKHLGPRAKGYCALRHKEATGTWPGDKDNIGKRKRAFESESLFFTPADLFSLREMPEVESIIACGASAYEDAYLPEIPHEISHSGGGLPFIIPVVAPVNIESGDGRVIHPMALSYRDLPLPLMWQIKTGAGHDGAVVVGRIDSIDVLENGSLGNARGVFDTNPYAKEAQRMVAEGFLNGVSVDLDRFKAVSKADPSLSASEGETRIGSDRTEIEEGRVMGITIVPKPAFQECRIYIDEEALAGEGSIVADGTYAGLPSNDADVEALVAAALVAAGIPVNPPSEWFHKPSLSGPTPLTITDDGRVFGHIADWGTDHIGLPMATKPPRSRSNYAFFHTGTLHTSDGDLVPVGQITLAGGHAPLHMDAASAAAHYDNTRSAWCDVHAGEDEFGIWVAGALRPSVTPEQIRAIRASAPSGDWRPIGGRLEMVAVCSVNVPGFPVTRAYVASGELMSLVAAGTSRLLEARKAVEDDGLSALAARIDRLEAPQRAKLDALRQASIQRRAEEVRGRFDELASSSTAEEFRDYSEEARAKYAEEGVALPDGSYPIKNKADLRNAIQAYGRAKDKKAAKKHIISRARDLDATDVLPSVWSNEVVVASAEEARARFRSFGVTTLSDRVEEARAAFAAKRDFDPKRHPRDDKGKFRKVLARLKSDLEEAKESGEDTGEKIKEVEQIQGKLSGGDLDAAKIAGARLLHALDKTDTEIGDARLSERLRDDYSLLGDVVYNIGVPVGDDNLLRWTELPPVLQNLVDELVKRIEEQQPEDEKGETAKAVLELQDFMSGDVQMNQGQISANLSKLVRLLV